MTRRPSERRYYIMQIYTKYISICMSCSLATAIARYICIIYGTMGPADVPQDGGDDEVHVEVTGQDDHADDAGLPPQGHRSVDYKTSKCEDRRWTSSSRGGSELKNIVCLSYQTNCNFSKQGAPVCRDYTQHFLRQFLPLEARR